MGDKLRRSLPGFVGGLVNGLFGGGGGLLLVPMLRRVAGLGVHQSHATAILTTFCLSIVSLVVYLFQGNIDWGYALPLAVGGAAGGAVGALWLKKIPARWLKKGFALFLLFSAWRMYVG
ncbi:MAG: sulfite exporter TauE/SafE family protein [Clostridiales bacterium]|nr:sulfite exporter TauE/SafE family protein [Clostridiales bacterium]